MSVRFLHEVLVPVVARQVLVVPVDGAGVGVHGESSSWSRARTASGRPRPRSRVGPAGDRAAAPRRPRRCGSARGRSCRGRPTERRGRGGRWAACPRSRRRDRRPRPRCVGAPALGPAVRVVSRHVAARLQARGAAGASADHVALDDHGAGRVADPLAVVRRAGFPSELAGARVDGGDLGVGRQVVEVLAVQGEVPRAVAELARTGGCRPAAPVGSPRSGRRWWRRAPAGGRSPAGRCTSRRR